MTWPPVSSEEVRELRELEEDVAEREAPAVHDARCVGGWLGEDAEGRPLPCSTCRPWLSDPPCVICNQPRSTCNTEVGRIGRRCCDHCQHTPTHR